MTHSPLSTHHGKTATRCSEHRSYRNDTFVPSPRLGDRLPGLHVGDLAADDRRHRDRRSLQREAAMTNDHARVLATLTENLRKINSLRDFVAACEVGSKIAGEMLTAMESHLLDCMDQIGD